jgi:hypothetical protein
MKRDQFKHAADASADIVQHSPLVADRYSFWAVFIVSGLSSHLLICWCGEVFRIPSVTDIDEASRDDREFRKKWSYPAACIFSW